MLDFRHETFYELCRIRSYTKTAEFLHLTQPAVSQHIRYLEKLYGGALFEYNGKKLTMTKRGEQLYRYMKVIRADSLKVTEELQRADDKHIVRFGATLTIGEYVMPDILQKILSENPAHHISMIIENTEILLQELDMGAIDFAIIEGYFDKTLYAAKRLSREKFIAVCSSESSLAGKTVPFDGITSRHLILREKGSGTREILLQALKAHNYSISSFEQVIEIGNMNAIKKLVKADIGISFMYRQAAKEELKRGTLSAFFIKDLPISHEFNFVFLKNSVYEKQYLEWFDIINHLYADCI